MWCSHDSMACSPSWEPGPLTSYHEREIKALLHRLPVHLVGQSGKAHVLLVDILGKEVAQVKGQQRFLGGEGSSPQACHLPVSGRIPGLGVGGVGIG